MNYAQFTWNDVLYRRRWIKRPYDSAPLACYACSGEIKGSHDTLLNGTMERFGKPAKPICCACMEWLLEHCPTVMAPEATEQPKQEDPEGKPCAICYHPIKGTPYTLADGNQVCWNNVCRPAGRSALMRKAALLEAQQEIEARYEPTLERIATNE
jgi:hypothetical protein